MGKRRRREYFKQCMNTEKMDSSSSISCCLNQCSKDIDCQQQCIEDYNATKPIVETFSRRKKSRVSYPYRFLAFILFFQGMVLFNIIHIPADRIKAFAVYVAIYIGAFILTHPSNKHDK